MKTWVRIRKYNNYQNFSVVTEDGNFVQFNAWPDGTIRTIDQTTVRSLGWPSVKEFLSERGGFVLL